MESSTWLLPGLEAVKLLYKIVTSPTLLLLTLPFFAWISSHPGPSLFLQRPPIPPTLSLLTLPFFGLLFFSDNFPNPFSSYPSPFRPTHLTIPPTLSLCANYFTMLIWILQPRLQAHNNIQCNQYKVKGFLSHQYV